MEARPSDVDVEVMVNRIASGELDLQPEFQRGEVWDIKRRQRLIDTLLREWYVPAVHIVQDDDRRSSVLDGQQRLVAIRDFFAGEFPVDGFVEPLDPKIQDLHGKYFGDLPQEVTRALKTYPLAVVYLREYTPGEPNELFFRLNQSYNLTPPEKRNALHGPARNQVRDLVEDLQSHGLLNRDLIGFSNQRLAYDDVVARACVAIEQGTLRKHINNTTVEQYYRSMDDFSGTTVEGIRIAGRELYDQVMGAGRVKFNKGTLQTWLLYCHWASELTGPLPSSLLERFEIDRQHVKRREFDQDTSQRQRLLSVVGVYDDRASYRVTDVSSVVARDLAIHLYSVATFGTEGRRRSLELVDRLEHDRRADPTTLMFDYMEQVQWGEPLDSD
ncbi:MAG: hypothetical protein JWP74_526 [Marmoricola sp.]|nr:hypothetical protein [Marmoricola sp.]